MKKTLLYVVLFAAPILCFGQSKIWDIDFEQSGDVIIIKYSLRLNESPKIKNVNAYMSTDGGLTYKQLRKVSGDVGTIDNSGNKQIVFDIFKEYGNEEISGDIQFTVEGTNVAPIKTKVFVEYVFSRAAPLGFTFGVCKRWGGYLSFKTDAVLARKAPSSGDGKYIVKEADFSTIDFDERKYYRLAWTTGIMLRLFKGCYLYSGLGYGAYGAAYQIVDTRAYYCPDLQKGLEVEGGMKIVLWNFLALSAGYNTILLSGNSQRFSDVNFGVGFSF
jgi:hypothetical protein